MEKSIKVSPIRALGHKKTGKRRQKCLQSGLLVAKRLESDIKLSAMDENLRKSQYH
jgi:hypothetical protein